MSFPRSKLSACLPKTGPNERRAGDNRRSYRPRTRHRSGRIETRFGRGELGNERVRPAAKVDAIVKARLLGTATGTPILVSPPTSWTVPSAAQGVTIATRTNRNPAGDALVGTTTRVWSLPVPRRQRRRSGCTTTRADGKSRGVCHSTDQQPSPAATATTKAHVRSRVENLRRTTGLPLNNSGLTCDTVSLQRRDI